MRQVALARRVGASGEVAPPLAEALRARGGAALSGYLSVRGEADPMPVMRDWDGPVGVPVVEAKAAPLGFRRWSPGCRLAPGTFGVPVPVDGAPMVPEVLIVPLLAFDARGFRLGYGGGFYDRTLERLRARGPVLAVGLAFAMQEVDAVPTEATDQPLDAVATEEGVRWFGSGAS
ncbi:5-formyltetrahydrofolate cyclo-ligase [Hasllibacter halocynthiae]|uniref:5-formyltetrahydrofolate cyclo-ligase n=2 Tax=Hasllibacter halocynthiae TaxID=595589 RepID=A0A2T0X6I0_9RHOB|nr:5-formyltetrahydrofolate cyclo-ligase [Hasllibacter halocynthiae]